MATPPSPFLPYSGEPLASYDLWEFSASILAKGFPDKCLPSMDNAALGRVQQTHVHSKERKTYDVFWSRVWRNSATSMGPPIQAISPGAMPIL